MGLAPATVISGLALLKRLREEAGKGWGEFIGRSAAMGEVYEMIQQAFAHPALQNGPAFFAVLPF